LEGVKWLKRGEKKVGNSCERAFLSGQKPGVGAWGGLERNVSKVSKSVEKCRIVSNCVEARASPSCPCGI
jgi:hypothetical protein